jgi:hypothetical protein
MSWSLYGINLPGTEGDWHANQQPTRHNKNATSLDESQKRKKSGQNEKAEINQPFVYA